MKVAVLAHSFPRFPGDTHGPFVKALSEELARLGHQVHALVPFDPELRPDPATPLRIHSFRYVWPDSLHWLGYSRTLKRDVGMRLGALLESPLYFFFAERALRRLVEREGIELIHAHWILPNGYVAARVARATGVKLAVTLHGSDVFMAEKGAMLGRMARTALGEAAHVTSCSADLRDRLVRVAGGEHAAKVLLVANGTDVVGRDAPAPDFVPLIAGERRLVAVGRLVDKKGFRELLAAMPRVLAAVPAARLVLGGGGELLGTLQEQARALGIERAVHFAGPLSHDQVLCLIASGEVFVMPSVRDQKGNIDGLPIVVLEAMAAGKPVVATDIAGMPLAVEHEKTGLLVAERDPQAIAGAVVRLLGDAALGRAYGEAGRARVASELNWKAIARIHDRLYARAAARK